jgi:hypothetical protein
VRYQVLKEENGYPDILSVSFNVKLTKQPVKYRLSDKEVSRFDLFIGGYYGSFDYLDLILFVNDVEYIHDLKIGDVLILPDKSDLDKFSFENRQ